MKTVLCVLSLLFASIGLISAVTFKQQIQPPLFIGPPSDSTLFGTSFHQTSDGQRLVVVGFIQASGFAYASIRVKNSTGYFVEYDTVFRGVSTRVITPTPGNLIESASYISEDGIVVLWGFYDPLNVDPGVVNYFFNDTGTYQYYQDFPDPFPVVGRIWARTFAVSRYGDTVAIVGVSTTESDRSIQLYTRVAGNPPDYAPSFTIPGNATDADVTWGEYITLSSSGRWLAVGCRAAQRYYIYDTLIGGNPVFTSDSSSGDISFDWSIVSFNDDETELRLGVGVYPATPPGEMTIRFFDGNWTAFSPTHLTDPVPGSPIQCKSMTFCENGHSLVCGGGSSQTQEPVIWLQDSPFLPTSSWIINDTLHVPFSGPDVFTLGLTPSSTTGMTPDGTKVIIGWSGLTLDSYGGSLLYYENLPGCSIPASPPVEPPISPPVTPPTSPPPIGPPTDPPSEPPVSPPISPPISTPTPPPVIAPSPTPTPVPVSPPVVTPVSPSTQTPVQPPVNITAPFNETVTPEILEAGTITISIYGVVYGFIVIFGIIIFIAICAQ